MLAKNEIQDLLQQALQQGADFAELFFEDTQTCNFKVMNQEIISYNIQNIYGVGIRLLRDTKEIYVYTNKLDYLSLSSLIKEYQDVFEKDYITPLVLLGEPQSFSNPVKKPFHILSTEKKIEKLLNLSRIMQEYDPKITKTIVSYEEKEQKVLIANSKGIYQNDVRPYIKCVLLAVAQEKENMQDFFGSDGRSMGLEFFDIINLEYLARQVAKNVIILLKAEELEPQTMTVVLNNGGGGVIFHEACGHSLEATAIAKGLSPFCGKLNQKIASDLVTAYDNGCIQNSWGSLHFDDEGMPTQKNLLIEKGILKNYLIDYRNSSKMKMAPTGSARRASYKYSPTSRMNSTYIDAGKDDPQQIIRDTKYGLYACSFSGGTVNTTTGDFNFMMKMGYLIENGQLTKPLKGMMLIGSGQDILLKIDRVGNDLLLDQGSYCGSVSGYVPVDLGQPTIRVSDIIIGGNKK